MYRGPRGGRRRCSRTRAPSSGSSGRRLELFRSGKKLRFVAWRTSTGVYWISNTLTMKLRDDQMLALAASLTSVGGERE